MGKFEYGISNKGDQIIIYKGFEYVRYRETAKGIIHCRCGKFRTLYYRSLIHTSGNKIVCHTNKIFESAAHKLANQMKIAMSHPGATARSVSYS